MLAALHTPEGLCHSAAAWREDAELILLCRMSQRCHCHVLQDSLESSLLSSGTPRHGVYGASSGALLRGPLGLPSPGMFPMSLPLTAGETDAASSGRLQPALARCGGSAPACMAVASSERLSEHFQRAAFSCGSGKSCHSFAQEIRSLVNAPYAKG